MYLNTAKLCVQSAVLEAGYKFSLQLSKDIKLVEYALR